VLGGGKVMSTLDLAIEGGSRSSYKWVRMWNVVWRSGSAFLFAAWVALGCASQQGLAQPSGERRLAPAPPPLLVTLDATGIVVATERLQNPSPDALRRAFARHRTGAPSARVVVGDEVTQARLAVLFHAVLGTDLSSLALEAGAVRVEIPIERSREQPTHFISVTSEGRASINWRKSESSNDSRGLIWSPGNAEEERALREELVRECSNEVCRVSTRLEGGATAATLIPVLASFKQVSEGLSLKWPLWSGTFTTVAGRLPPAVIQRIVRSHFGAFRRCYEQGLARDPDLRGSIRARFVIGRDGKVSHVSDHGSDIPDAEVRDCVLKAFYELVFPAPAGGITTVVYPIMLAPG
jgi:hypothetical protein